MQKYLVAEFGGTNARFSLVDPAQPSCLMDLTFRSCTDFESAEAAVGWYLEQMGAPEIAAACISFAGPSDTPTYHLTNMDWTLSPETMQSVVGGAPVEFLNDFEALAYALPFLSPDKLVEVRGGFQSLGKPKVVLGPGTGLGVAGLLANSDQTYTVVKSEGGGIGFAPEDELEQEIMLHLGRSLGRVTCEDLLCGRGVVRLYGAVSEIAGEFPGDFSPAEISERALAGADATCERTILTFCHILGHFAGDLALMFNAAGGVYLGGGILPQIKELFLRSDFVARFEARGAKSHLVKNTPVYLIEEDVPALVGAAFWLKHQLSVRKGH